MLDHKGGHEVGRAEVPRLSFEAARPKAEVVANGQAHAYLPTYLPNQRGGQGGGGSPRAARRCLTTNQIRWGWCHFWANAI